MLQACTYSTLHFFPSIVGTVTINGKPLKNVEVEYISIKINYAKIEKYKTDITGKFSIPLNTYSGIVGPHVHRIESRIYIYHENRVYIGFLGVRDYMDNLKIDVSKPIKLSCELSRSPSEGIIPDLNGDRYWGKNEMEYSYSGVCAYNKPFKQDK
jgi:hypothetical protein